MLNPSFIVSAKNPFEVFQIKPSFELDLEKLEDAYFDLTKQVHPDHFSNTASHEITAKLNQAFQTLKKRDLRLEALLTLAGHGLIEGKSVTPNADTMELAEEFFELQELFMEDEDKNFSSKANAFSEKITRLLDKSSHDLYALASQTDWENVLSHSSQEKIKEILEIRKKVNYIHSLKINLNKFHRSTS